MCGSCTQFILRIENSSFTTPGNKEINREIKNASFSKNMKTHEYWYGLSRNWHKLNTFFTIPCLENYSIFLACSDSDFQILEPSVLKILTLKFNPVALFFDRSLGLHMKFDHSLYKFSYILDFWKLCWFDWLVQSRWLVLSRMLKSLAGYLTKLSASDFYWILF